MTYNVFGGTLSLTQSINHVCTQALPLTQFSSLHLPMCLYLVTVISLARPLSPLAGVKTFLSQYWYA